MQRDRVIQEVGGGLHKLGFTRKGTTWRRETDHGIEVFNIQGSTFNAGAFYLNIGIYLGRVRDVPEPREHDCELRERVAHEGRDGSDVLESIRAWFDIEGRRIEERSRPPSRPPARVTHEQFGAGTVISEHDDRMTIAFEDGSTRVLKRVFVTLVDDR
ncbi:MAG TPA: DUF4304 domain-containing protein [Kofleriaceae bacterium]